MMSADTALGADDFWRSAMALHTLRAPGAGGTVPVRGSRAEGVLLSAHDLVRSQAALPWDYRAPGFSSSATVPEDPPPAGGAPSPPVITPGDHPTPHPDSEVAPAGRVSDPLGGHIYAKTLPDLCCCPTDITIEGGAGDGSYKLSFPWDVTKYEWLAKQRVDPDAPGHTFVATTHFTMKPYKEYRPCILEWYEEIVERGERRVRDQRRDMNESPTFETWNERMDGNPETVPLDPNVTLSPRRAKSPSSPVDVAKPYGPGPGSIPAYDIPSHPDYKQETARDYKRTIEGEIVVRPGCPDCEAQRAFWSQFISVTNNIPTRSWLAHSEEGREAPSGEKIRSPHEDNVPNHGGEYERWRAKELARLAAMKRSVK